SLIWLCLSSVSETVNFAFIKPACGQSFLRSPGKLSLSPPFMSAPSKSRKSDDKDEGQKKADPNMVRSDTPMAQITAAGGPPPVPLPRPPSSAAAVKRLLPLHSPGQGKPLSLGASAPNKRSMEQVAASVVEGFSKATAGHAAGRPWLHLIDFGATLWPELTEI